MKETARDRYYRRRGQEVSPVTASYHKNKKKCDVAYGSLIRENVFQTVTTGSTVDFLSIGPPQNVSADPALNAIVILKEGVYEVSADITVERSNGFIAFRFFENDQAIPGSSFSASTNGREQIGKSFLAYFNAGDRITIQVTAFGGIAGTPPPQILHAFFLC